MSSFDHPAGCEPRRIVFWFLLVLVGTLASAQNPLPVEDQGQQLAASVPAQRPRIGLALSGGGALGLAQIGVIQWLEENHIPVDRMAGTSMGSIIGVMYATGMSPAEMQKLAEGIDWNEALLPEPKYRQLSYRRKQDRRDYQVEAALGVKHGLRGPNGFDPGLSVGLLLDRIAFSESGIASFDELPIPFRCVATDMQSGDRVVLHNGSLPKAVRASMAIPGVFTPVEIDGRVLADGGMVENIPVEAVREMDADSVIAVDLQLPPGGREQLETLTGVLSRAVSVMILQNERRSLALASTTITVDTGNFSIGVMHPDGSGERMITNGYHDEGPTWAPNGRVLMFTREAPGGRGAQIWSVDVTGRNERRVLTPGDASDPAWSPLIQ